MVTAAQLTKKYGIPGKNESHMAVWNVPLDIQAAFTHVKFSAMGTIGFPKKIYANKEFTVCLMRGLRNVIERGLTSQIKVWDGCYGIRKQRQGSSYSLHSWGEAFDINAAENLQGKKPKLSPELVKCFTDAELDWGGFWKGASIDGMHFQIAKLY